MGVDGHGEVQVVAVVSAFAVHPFGVNQRVEEASNSPSEGSDGNLTELCKMVDSCNVPSFNGKYLRSNLLMVYI